MTTDPTFGNTGTIAVDEAGGGTATNLAVTLASTATGDLNIVILTCSGNSGGNLDPGLPLIGGVSVASAGWTLLQSIVDTSSSTAMPRCTVVARKRQAGDPTSITFSWANPANAVGRAYSWNAGTFDPSAPVPVSVGQAQSPSSTSFAAPSMVTSVRGTVFGVYFCRNSGTWTPPDASRGGAPSAPASAANFATSESTAVDAGTYTKTGTFSVATSVGGAIAVLVASNPANPPTAAFSSSAVGLAASFDGSASTAVGPATISSYAWDFGDSTTGTGATPSHTYNAAGSYSVGLTVTDSNGATAAVIHSITVAPPNGTVSVQSVTVSTGWTPSTGTVLSAITDGDPNTFDTSTAGPTGQELDCILGALVAPAAGQPLKVFIQMDALTATSASLNAQLYEGATSRATLTGIAIPSGAGATVTGLVTLTFPWSLVSAISTGGWSALTVKLQITAA